MLAVLVLPNDRQPFRIKSDSSNFASGGVLQQLLEDDGKWHPSRIPFQELDPRSNKTTTCTTRSFLAIVRCLEQWRHFLEGARHQVEIWTDHRNLEYFRTVQDLQPEASAMVPLPFPLRLLPPSPPVSLNGRTGCTLLCRGGITDADRRITRGVVLPRPVRVPDPRPSRHARTRTGKSTSCTTSESAWRRKEPLRNPLWAAAQRLRRAKATGQVHKTEWDETDGLLTFNGPDLRSGLKGSSPADYRTVPQLPGRWAPGMHEDAGVDLPGLLVASDRKTRWVLHPDVRGMSPEQGNPSSSYRGTQPDPARLKTMGTGQRGLHRGTSGLARLQCDHGRSGFRDEAASLHPD